MNYKIHICIGAAVLFVFVTAASTLPFPMKAVLCGISGYLCAQVYDHWR